MLYNVSSMYLLCAVSIASNKYSVVLLGVLSEVLGIGRHIPVLYGCKVVVDSIKIFLILNPNEGGCMVHRISKREVVANAARYDGWCDETEVEVGREYSSWDDWNPDPNTIYVGDICSEYEIRNNYNKFTVQDMVKEGVLS